MWEWTDKGVSIIYSKPFLLKKLAYLCVYAVTLMYNLL